MRRNSGVSGFMQPANRRSSGGWSQAKDFGVLHRYLSLPIVGWEVFHALGWNACGVLIPVAMLAVGVSSFPWGRPPRIWIFSYPSKLQFGRWVPLHLFFPLIFFVRVPKCRCGPQPRGDWLRELPQVFHGVMQRQDRWASVKWSSHENLWWWSRPNVFSDY